MENILEKRRNEAEKNECEMFHFFMLYSYKLQILLTKTSILYDNENVVFILIYKIFPKI